MASEGTEDEYPEHEMDIDGDDEDGNDEEELQKRDIMLDMIRMLQFGLLKMAGISSKVLVRWSSWLHLVLLNFV